MPITGELQIANRNLRIASVLLLLILCAPATAQTRLLIVSQAEPGADKNNFVDFSPVLARDLLETGKFDPVVFKPSLKPIQDALASKTLSQADVAAPMSADSIHRVARVLGIDMVLRITGRRSKDGIGGAAELQRPVDQTHWVTVFAQQLAPYKGQGKNPSVLEAIHAQVNAIISRMTGKLETTTLPGPKNNSARKTEPTPVDIPPTRPEPDKTVSEPDVPKPVLPSPYEAAAQKLRAAGDQAGTITALRKAINDKPRDATLRRELVRAYLERGWSSAARDEAVRAISASPDDPALRRLLGDTYLDQGDGEKALIEFQAAIKLNSKDATLHIALGDAFWNLARVDDAEKAFKEAALADPKSALAHRRLARLYVQRGKLKECAAEMASARELTSIEEYPKYVEDYAGILGTAETLLTGILARLQDAHKSLASGSKTREQVFAAVAAEKKKADDLSAFLETFPTATGFEKVAALYTQAGDAVSQAVEAAMQHVESQESSKEQQATLLRLEASKQLAEATKRLKAQLARKPGSTT